MVSAAPQEDPHDPQTQGTHLRRCCLRWRMEQNGVAQPLKLKLHERKPRTLPAVMLLS